MSRIEVDVPTSDARRDRIEREVLAQVAAMRAADRTNASIVLALGRSRRRWWIAGGLALAAAAIAIVVLRGGDASERAPQIAAAPSRVVTPAGGSSRFTIDDAVVDAGSDTSVEVQRDADGGVTLVLARGSVDCDVAPRGDRAPFRVTAGDVTVQVVGTRFTVARTPSVRVDVARGKVRVTEGGEATYVAAGESWPAITSRSSPQDSQASEPDIEVDPSPTPTLTPTPTPTRAEVATKAQLDEAEKHGPPALRKVANMNGPFAAIALFDHAQAISTSNPDGALRDLADYERRFPNAANSEDVAWTRVEILKKQHRDAEMHRAAAQFVRRYPKSVYAATAKQLAAP